MSEKVKFIFPADPDAPIFRTWPCIIEEPMDGGTKRKLSLDVRFKVMASEDIILAYRLGDRGLWETAVDGFPSFNDANGKKVDDKQAKEFFGKLPYAMTGILEGYFEMLGTRLTKN